MVWQSSRRHPASYIPDQVAPLRATFVHQHDARTFTQNAHPMHRQSTPIDCYRVPSRSADAWSVGCPASRTASGTWCASLVPTEIIAAWGSACGTVSEAGSRDFEIRVCFA